MSPNCRYSLALALLLSVASALYAQSPLRDAPGNQAPVTGRNVQAKLLMPVSLTAITTLTVQLHSMVISNPTTSSATFTVQDGDGATYAFAKDVLIDANSMYVMPLGNGGTEFKNGVFVSSSTGTLVVRAKGWVE